MELIVMTHPATSGISQILLLVIGLLGTLAPFQELAAKDIYKWVDAAGKTHYTQFPPPDGTAAVEVRPAPPPATDSGAASEQLQQQVEAMEMRREAEAQAKSVAEIDAEIARIVKENCTAARNNLAALQQGGEKRYLTSEGEVIRLTEEDRQRRIAEANSQIQEFCK